VVSSLESDGVAGILGRSEELAALRGFAADLHTGPAAVVIEGEPGIGKTTLWSAAVDSARDASCCVLVSRPVGSEIKLAYAGLGDLLGDVLAGALSELPAPQRRALRVALLLEDPRGRPPDQRGIALAVLGVLRALAETRPVVVAIDDLQYLDRPTAATLEFAFRRLRREPIGVLAALRVESGDTAHQGLADGFPESRRSRLRVRPLSAGATHRLVRARLGLSLPRPVLLRLHEVSGGNPFYALELARALGAVGVRLEPGDRMPISASLQELVRRRLTALPSAVQDVMLAAAALSVPTVRAVQAVTPAGARSRLAAAADAGVLVLEGPRVRFAHPLLAAGIYSGADPVRRRRLHRRLAASVTDREEQARHLALGTVRANANVAAALDDAARHAAARGAPHTAAELYELAADATPRRTPADLRKRRLAAADAHVASGAIGRARAIIDAVLAELPPGDERAAVLLQAEQVAQGFDEFSEFGQRALSDATDDGLAASAHLLLSRTWPNSGMDDALRHGRLALEHALRAEDPALVARVLTRLVQWELWAGVATPGLMERALASMRGHEGLRAYDDPRMPFALRLMYQGRLDEARTLFAELLADAERLGDEVASVSARGRLIDVALRAGEWRSAEDHAELAYEHQDQIGLGHDAGFTVYWRALVLAHYGRVEDARRSGRLGVELADAAHSTNLRVLNLGVLGFVELSLGNAAAARDHLAPAIEWVESKGLGLSTLPVAPYALEAFVNTGDLERAEALIERFERESRTLESPWGIAIALRCRGTAAAARGDLAGATDFLGRATELSDGRGWAFEHARTQLALGRTQRRARRKRAARASLEAALATFEELGARLWAEQARRELRSIGGRAPSRGRLTSMEERVAALVAQGRSNRQVAASLYVAERTVEGHLTRIYAKLGVQSRAELAHRFAAR
jgi:DNA-binding CsgD family transcriptional regulator